MIAVLVVHGVLGGLLLVVGNRLGRTALLVGAVAPLTGLAWACARYRDVTSGAVITERLPWVDGLDLALDLRLDGLALTMALIVTGIGVLVLVYAAGYVDADATDAGRLAGLLVLFAGAMLGLVLSDHLIALYGFWEATSVLSFFLIASRYTDPGARAAALQALLVTAAGGLAMLGGFIVLGQQSGTYLLSELATAVPPTGVAVGVALALVLLGAFTKSAQYPFQAWLPAAMVAPTPVSAYLHSATMVKAGVYLVARLAPIFAAAAIWRPAVFVIGLVTLVMGGLRALQQHDLKLLLAYGTISQLGLMIVLFGAGTPALATAGWVLLGAHAAFKAALFMVVGILEHQTGTRDVRELPALGRSWRWVEAIALVSVVSMAGVPLAIGFVAKEEIYAAFTDASFGASGAVFAVVVAGSMLTVAYATRFYVAAFVVPRRRARAASGLSPVTTPSGAFWAPAAPLAVGSVVLGIAPQLEDSLASATARSFGAARAVDLELWHGFNLPLALSVLTVAGGLVVWTIANRARRFAAGEAAAPPPRAYLAMLRGLAVVSRQVTGVVQNGSLPVYAGVILATAAILPGVALVSSWEWSGWPAVVGPIATVPIVAMLAITAFGAATVRRRFSAAIFLGATGYAMAALFVLRGAPDLALTQVAIETLSTVLFVLVLRRLPDRFERQSTPVRRVVRFVIAAIVGVTVFVFAIAASGVPVDDAVSDEIIGRALPDGHGRNVVNVILVDFRGLDTLGEITVLAVASIGAVALARAVSSGTPRRRRAADTRTTRGRRLPRVVFVDVSAQIVFHAVLMGSLWLLFAGHNQPGGGFVAGLLAGSAISLQYIAGGIDEVRTLSRFRPWTVLGFGLGVAAVTATAPLLAGDAVLDVATASVSVPVFGDVTLSSALVFDVGVFLTVIGMVLMAFEAFGDDPSEVRP